MAALHAALQTLAPTAFSSVPVNSLKPYLEESFANCQLLVDSVPPPPEEIISTAIAAFRSRSNTTTSVASSASEISASSARPPPPDPAHAALQKEWGKPIKLGAKENPLGMAVYKLASKDGKGSWFARRSVHEGLGFSKWKKGLQMEFPESLAVKGGPGEGNVRGIGGERRVERKVCEGLGKLEVYHLSAQFPGPTTPRDFVTLLLSSSSALNYCSSSSLPELSSHALSDKRSSAPRHFIVISKPCIHPDCPPRNGFIRGEYESIEFIREIPIKSPSRINTSQSASNLLAGNPKNDQYSKTSASQGSSEAGSSGSNGEEGEVDSSEELQLKPSSNNPEDPAGRIESEGRKRGKTISFAESRGLHAKGEQFDTSGPEQDDAEDETNPVEWIMITRSDPGGSVPRWMVERGTPGGIVSDASKFLDWACRKTHFDMTDEDTIDEDLENMELEVGESEEGLRDFQTNGHLAGLTSKSSENENDDTNTVRDTDGVIRSSAEASNIKPGNPGATNHESDACSESDSSSTVGSFATAFDDGEGHETPTKPSSDQDNQSTYADSSHASTTTKESGSAPSPADKELARLAERRKTLVEKIIKSEELSSKRSIDLSTREAATRTKLEEKYRKDIAKEEERYRREVAKLEVKNAKEAKKAEERRRKAEDKDILAKVTRERDDARAQLEVAKKEREILLSQVGDLQRVNTMLVGRLGKMKGAEDVLKEVRDGSSNGSVRSLGASIKGRSRGVSIGVGGLRGSWSGSDSVAGLKPAKSSEDVAGEKV
ncbi:MAG: hypothetical protein M1829_005130 [Trizodia sp. TS-e1964]|nr:MAG: hypothetical protein M1829_005130 [Trizodia sp. TS-e1964]